MATDRPAVGANGSSGTARPPAARVRQAAGRSAGAVRVRFCARLRRGNTRPGKAGNFFFAPIPSIRFWRSCGSGFPGQAERIVQQADQICQHRFDLLGYTGVLTTAGPIDWHLDAVHEKRAPQKAFYKIHYLDYAEVGDSKVTWELNRHQHLVTLAKAYRLTGDRRFADEISAAVAALAGRRTLIPWASIGPAALEVAFRSLSWLGRIICCKVLPGCPISATSGCAGWRLHGRHIERYLSTYFSPNTHLLGEGVALFFLGVLCPELSAAERWKALGWKIVLQEAERQVRADGFHFEQSTYYHVYALDFFLHSAVLAGV